MSTTTAATVTQAPDYAAPQLQRREYVARATSDTEHRQVLGVAVPWDQEEEIVPGFFERWAPGSAQAPEDGTKLFWRHTEPIGRLVATEDGAEGWQVTAQVSRTRQGEEALVLVDDEVITRMSVGFRAIEWDTSEDDNGDLHVTITRAEVREVSLVPFPAFSGATVTGRRNRPEQHETQLEGTTMPEQNQDETRETGPDLAEVRNDITELQRQVVGLREYGDDNRAEDQAMYRSIGEYAQALAAGDERAAALFQRETATTADSIMSTGDNWVGNTVRIIQARQRIARLFNFTQNLPSRGNTVEYGELTGNTVVVEEQATEGADLTFGKVSLGTANAPVKTFGGYTEISRQVIERSSIEYLDFAFQAFAAAYGKAIETYARTVVQAGYDSQVTAGSVVYLGADLATADADDWLSALIDADEAVDEAGHALAGLLVSKSVFKQLAQVPMENRLLKWVGAPDQHGGTLQVRGMSGALATVPITVNPAWAGVDRAMGFDPFAVSTREAPGAPFRLQDENILNLSKQYSVYGYGTSYVQAANALVPIELSAEV